MVTHNHARTHNFVWRSATAASEQEADDAPFAGILWLDHLPVAPLFRRFLHARSKPLLGFLELVLLRRELLLVLIKQLAPTVDLLLTVIQLLALLRIPL